MKSVSAQKVYHNYLSEHKHMKSQDCQFSYNAFTNNFNNIITMVSTYMFYITVSKAYSFCML